MEISLFDAAIKGFLNILQLKVFLAMMIGVSIGTFTAVAPQGLGMPLVYAIAAADRDQVGAPHRHRAVHRRKLSERDLRRLPADPFWHPRRLRLPGHGARRLPDGQEGRGPARARRLVHGRRHGMPDRHLHSRYWRFP